MPVPNLKNNCQHTFGTFASPTTHGNASPCKRAFFLPGPPADNCIFVVYDQPLRKIVISGNTNPETTESAE